MEFDNSAFEDRELVSQTAEYEKSLSVTVNKKLDNFKVKIKILHAVKKHRFHASRIRFYLQFTVDTDFSLLSSTAVQLCTQTVKSVLTITKTMHGRAHSPLAKTCFPIIFNN